MNEVLEQLTQRDIFFMLAGGGIVAGLSLVFRAIFDKLFEIYDEQKKGLLALKDQFGPVVTPAQLEAGK
jgi:threonine dehydratase